MKEGGRLGSIKKSFINELISSKLRTTKTIIKMHFQFNFCNFLGVMGFKSNTGEYGYFLELRNLIILCSTLHVALPRADLIGPPLNT